MFGCVFSCHYLQGVVNDRFAELISGEPDYVVKLIEGYLADIEMILFELSRNGESSKIDFSMVASLAHEIEDKSAS
ncbi:hypothetical protein RIF29_27535 [Crotalaria pallida]|uniref:Uncharacterized protein n=1 Tax=Crotalaria pallida TaxID=3830 RepID=A0AAN9ERF7_CROPI